MTQPLLISGGRVVTMADGQPDEQALDVLIDNGRIADLLPPGTRVENARVIPADGKIVAPGFVDTHRHVWQTQLRTVAADWTLFEYIVNIRAVYSGFYGPEDAYLGNHLGALEALNAGVTTLVDHSHLVNSPQHADRLIDGLADAGLRARFCYGMFMNPKFDAAVQARSASWPRETSPGWRYDDVRRVRKERLASDDALLTLGVNPQEAESVPIDTLLHEIALSRELGVGTISMHVAMGGYDHGTQLVRALAERRRLGPDLLFVHGAALTDEELRLISEHQCGLSTTPETELQMGLGYPLALSGRDAGTRISLGIDIVSNYPGDMFTQMRLALQTARAKDNAELAREGRGPRKLRVKVRDALRVATLGGAEAIHLEKKIGSLEKGKAADLIVIATDGLAMVPAHDAVAAIVLGAAPTDVETVIVDGVVRKEARALVGVDLPRLQDRLRESSERIYASAKQVPRGEIEAFLASRFRV